MAGGVQPHDAVRGAGLLPATREGHLSPLVQAGPAISVNQESKGQAGPSSEVGAGSLGPNQSGPQDKDGKETAMRFLLRAAKSGVPSGMYMVDAEALRRARQGVPRGEYHVDAEALRRARQGVPRGEYHRA